MLREEAPNDYDKFWNWDDAKYWSNDEILF